jgi:DNA-binding response OmpR family regulator
MRSRGQLVTYEQLAEAVWAVTTGPESNSLEVHVSRIRQKLEGGGESRLIQTVRGIGYRFIAEAPERAQGADKSSEEVST